MLKCEGTINLPTKKMSQSDIFNTLCTFNTCFLNNSTPWGLYEFTLLNHLVMGTVN